MRFPKIQMIATYAAVLILAAAGAASTDARHREPADRFTAIEPAYFGDETNVRLLADFLDDPDPRVRAKAVRDLGETRNALAVDAIRQAFDDANPAVRAAAVDAASMFHYSQVEDIFERASKSDATPVILAVLRACGSMEDGQAGLLTLEGAEMLKRAAVAFTDHPEPAVQLAAVRMLNRTQWAVVPAEDMEGLLTSGSVAVRAAALENALFADAPPELAKLRRLGETDRPSVREPALAALGKWDFAASSEPLAAAGRDANPLVRRGAVRGYRLAERADLVRPFLDDPSGAVRLAAVRAAGAMKCVDCVDKVYEIMLSGSDDQTHQAARDALVAIGSPRVGRIAAGMLGPLYERYRDYQSPATMPADAGPVQRHQRHYLERNIRSLCVLLGAYRNADALEVQLRMLEELSEGSEILTELADAIGLIGDPRAVPHVVEAMERFERVGRKYLIAVTTIGTPPVPYNLDAVGRTMRAAGRLGVADAAAVIRRIALAKRSYARLDVPAAYAMSVLPSLAPDGQRDEVAAAIVAILRDRQYASAARYMAAKAAAELHVEAAVEPLERTLNVERSSRPLMRAAAWALLQLTGRAPDIPDPVVRQNADWIVRKTASAPGPEN